VCVTAADDDICLAVVVSFVQLTSRLMLSVFTSKCHSPICCMAKQSTFVSLDES